MRDHFSLAWWVYLLKNALYQSFRLHWKKHVCPSFRHKNMPVSQLDTVCQSYDYILTLYYILTCFLAPRFLLLIYGHGSNSWAKYKILWSSRPEDIWKEWEDIESPLKCVFERESVKSCIWRPEKKHKKRIKCGAKHTANSLTDFNVNVSITVCCGLSKSNSSVNMAMCALSCPYP